MIFPELLPEHLLIELPHTGLGDRFHKHDVIRQPPLGKARPQELQELLFGDDPLKLRPRDHDRQWALLPLRVRDGDDGGLQDFGVGHQGVLQIH